MSDDLYGYLDTSGPLYDYLGHFRDMEYLCEGHNELPLQQAIENGEIPNLSQLKGMQSPGSIGNVSNEEY